MVVFSCVVELYRRQELLNFAVVVFGELSVTLTGTTKMHLWCVESWDCQPLVKIFNTTIDRLIGLVAMKSLANPDWVMIMMCWVMISHWDRAAACW